MEAKLKRGRAETDLVFWSALLKKRQTKKKSA